MDIKIFASAIAQIAEEKGIAEEKVFEIIEQAIAAAYKKDYGQKGQKIEAKLNQKTGEVKFWQVKLVVDQGMLLTDEELEKMKAENKEEFEEKEGEPKEKKVKFNPERHIMIEEAEKTDSKIKVGEELKILLKTQEDYGRIAAQTAKQVILQRIKEAERDTVLDEFRKKEGEIISGIIQRIEGKTIYLNLGKTVGVLPLEEQVIGEFYRISQRLKVYLLKVEETSKGPLVFVSRVYPKLVSKLFELEVPEISSGQVEIKSIAREAGSRSKIAVSATDKGIDPIGSVVGQRGTRVMAVINELGGEKIDVIEWAENPEKFIANSLAPAKVSAVKIGAKNTAQALVPEDQLSLAIGKNGQNVRLAAKLTGWKIDVKSETSPEEPTEELEKEKTSEKKEPKKEPSSAEVDSATKVKSEGEERPKKETKKEKK
ncbi:MAG: transcription termination factor NusA [Candidatus Nealsonbacteria bacterium]|nr:transcription termination factor NusA [Candidatus Nealsonbacteria bacterium]